MSAPNYTDDRELPPGRQSAASPVMKIVAAVAAVAVLALGASAAISKRGPSSSSSSGTQSTQSAQPDGQPAGGPQMGTAVTGATLTKLKSVVTAKHPGTIERALKLAGGTYEVHVIQASGREVHVLVSADFRRVTKNTGPVTADSGSGSQCQLASRSRAWQSRASSASTATLAAV